VVATQKQAQVTLVLFFTSFYCPQLFYCPPDLPLFGRPWVYSCNVVTQITK